MDLLNKIKDKEKELTLSYNKLKQLENNNYISLNKKML